MSSKNGHAIVKDESANKRRKAFHNYSQHHKAEIFMLLVPCFCERLLTKINRQYLYFEISCIWQIILTFVSCLVSLLRVDELYQGFWILESDDKTQAYFLYLYLLRSGMKERSHKAKMNLVNKGNLSLSGTSEKRCFG